MNTTRNILRWTRHISRRYLGGLLPPKVITVQPECWCGTNHVGDYWHDPTHGRIDRDIQDKVAAAYGPDLSVAEKVAIENTLQTRRDRGQSI